MIFTTVRAISDGDFQQSTIRRPCHKIDALANTPSSFRFTFWNVPKHKNNRCIHALWQNSLLFEKFAYSFCWRTLTEIRPHLLKQYIKLGQIRKVKKVSWYNSPKRLIFKEFLNCDNGSDFHNQRPFWICSKLYCVFPPIY